MTPFSTGFLLGAVVGAGLTCMVALIVVWAWLEHEEREYNLHASFEKARRP